MKPIANTAQKTPKIAFPPITFCSYCAVPIHWELFSFFVDTKRKHRAASIPPSAITLGVNEIFHNFLPLSFANELFSSSSFFSGLSNDELEEQLLDSLSEERRLKSDKWRESLFIEELLMLCWNIFKLFHRLDDSVNLFGGKEKRILQESEAITNVGPSSNSKVSSSTPWLAFTSSEQSLNMLGWWKTLWVRLSVAKANEKLFSEK